MKLIAQKSTNILICVKSLRNSHLITTTSQVSSLLGSMVLFQTVISQFTMFCDVNSATSCRCQIRRFEIERLG